MTTRLRLPFGLFALIVAVMSVMCIWVGFRGGYAAAERDAAVKAEKAMSTLTTECKDVLTKTETTTVEMVELMDEFENDLAGIQMMTARLESNLDALIRKCKQVMEDHGVELGTEELEKVSDDLKKLEQDLGERKAQSEKIDGDIKDESTEIKRILGQ